MQPTGPSIATRDFYDRRNDFARFVLGLGSLLLFTAFLATSFWRADDSFFLLLSCLLIPTILLALPRLLRGAVLAYRGTPALRIDERGFWAREWSYLGWIAWGDVASVEIVSGPSGKSHAVEIHLRDKAFARLSGHDQVSVMLARLAGFLVFTDVGRNTLPLTSSSELTSSWEEFVATLDPILATNGVPKLEKTDFRIG